MLYQIATPIGNLEDTSTRALDTLRRADVLACEDTRRTLILLNRFEIRRPAVTISYRQGNEERVGQQLLDYVAEGKTVAVCSDSGYPGISDPGYRLVRLAVEKGVPFEVIPGASAIPVALLLSGLPTSSYTFKGYPPRKPGPLRTFFDEEKDRPHTLILFESPHRVGTALQAAAEVLGDREAAVCVELTKKFERVHRGYLMELAARFEKEEVRGEVTIVVAGDNPKFLRPPLCPSHGDGQPE